MAGDVLTHHEEWREIPGSDGYEVSSLGRVRRGDICQEYTDRRGFRVSRIFKGRVLSTGRHSQGYRNVSIRWKDGRYRSELVHRLVLKAFVGEPEWGQQACHNDGDRTNNILSNLRWDTVTHNHWDKYAHGTALIGERNHQSRLTTAAVRRIRSSHARAVKEIAEREGVPVAIVRRVLKQETWRHVDAEGV